MAIMDVVSDVESIRNELQEEEDESQEAAVQVEQQSDKGEAA